MEENNVNGSENSIPLIKEKPKLTKRKKVNKPNGSKKVKVYNMKVQMENSQVY